MYFITVYDKRLESTEHEFGEIWNNDSGSSTSFEYTIQKQLSLICVCWNKYKGEGFHK